MKPTAHVKGIVFGATVVNVFHHVKSVTITVTALMAVMNSTALTVVLETFIVLGTLIDVYDHVLVVMAFMTVRITRMNTIAPANQNSSDVEMASVLHKPIDVIGRTIVLMVLMNPIVHVCLPSSGVKAVALVYRSHGTVIDTPAIAVTAQMNLITAQEPAVLGIFCAPWITTVFIRVMSVMVRATALAAMMSRTAPVGQISSDVRTEDVYQTVRFVMAVAIVVTVPMNQPIAQEHVHRVNFCVGLHIRRIRIA
jgi:hypothetical protein